MKLKLLSFTILTFAAFGLLAGNSKDAYASSLGQKGSVSVTDSGKTDPVDPEDPGEGTDPGESPSTSGTLRIDFVSSLRFGNAKITAKDRTFHALAQNFHDETSARGSYIQITDRRPDASGWTLQVKQNTQFHNSVIQNAAEQELTGAVLSLDKGWANSSGTSGIPTVTRNTIALSEIGAAYTVATASEGQGKGVWTIEFGASSGNTSGQENTLKALTDDEGNAVMDSSYSKQAYSNSAVSLKIPETTKIYPVQYQTELTWILAELP